MNATIPKPRLPWLSFGLLVALLCFAPFAISFPPQVVNGVADQREASRNALVILGLMSASAALVEFAALGRHTRNDLIWISCLLSVFLACAVVGWRSYPYWVTGVYQVSIGSFSPIDQDPKSLIPMTWLGEFWRFPVLVLYLLCYPIIPILSVTAVVAFLRRRFLPATVTAACIAISLTFMIGFSPGYISWLLD